MQTPILLRKAYLCAHVNPNIVMRKAIAPQGQAKETFSDSFETFKTRKANRFRQLLQPVLKKMKAGLTLIGSALKAFFNFFSASDWVIVLFDFAPNIIGSFHHWL